MRIEKAVRLVKETGFYRRKELAMKIMGRTRCIKCGKVIAVTEQVETNKGFAYIKHNEKCRFIDKWGFERNFCKTCMK